MKFKIVLVVSLLFNLVFIFFGAVDFKDKGGLYYLKAKVAKAKIVVPYYQDRVSMFKDFAIQKKSNVFIGDSEIDYAELNELFNTNDVANRGIAGDTTIGVANRIDNLKALSPSKIYVWVGINDLQQNVDETVIMNNYNRIIEEIRDILPNSEINFLSVMNVNSNLYDLVYLKNGDGLNKKVEVLNDDLIKLSKKNGCNFINVNDVLSKDHQLIKNYTTDGLHLNSKGYEKLKTKIKL